MGDSRNNSIFQKIKLVTGARIFKYKVLDLIRFDSKISACALFIFYSVKYLITWMIKGRSQALIVAGDCFRRVPFFWSRMIATFVLRRSIQQAGIDGIGQDMMQHVKKKIDSKVIIKLKDSVLNNTLPFFDKRLIILSSPTGSSKGVLLVKFTDYFKYLNEVFDLKKLAEDYILILEPSFSGYFDEDILCMLSNDIPMIIQAPEPVDLNFIRSISSNLYPIDIGANCWVDDRVFSPINGSTKKYDVIMVAIWADFKRHFHLFEAMSKCKKDIRVALVGKPWTKSIEQIREEALFYGVIDQIDFFENISQKEINKLFNESKLFLLISKKEGINKAIIEAMYSGLPAFLLEGFNFGYKYEYINNKTGGFVKSDELTEFLDNIDSMVHENSFQPHEWIMANLSPKNTMQKLIGLLNHIENELSISINKDLHIKVNTPELNYYYEHSRESLSADYRSLANYLR